MYQTSQHQASLQQGALRQASLRQRSFSQDKSQPDPTDSASDTEECKQKQRQRRLTAYHEAGHAVMAILLGRNVHRVSIIPKQSRLGACELKKDVSKIAKDPLEADALILLSGMVAEARISGRYGTEGAKSDLINVERLAFSRGSSEASAQRLAKRWLDKTEHLLDQPENLAAIEAIASQLLERDKISGRNAVHHYNEAVIRAKKNRN